MGQRITTLRGPAFASFLRPSYDYIIKKGTTWQVKTLKEELGLSGKEHKTPKERVYSIIMVEDNPCNVHIAMIEKYDHSKQIDLSAQKWISPYIDAISEGHHMKFLCSCSKTFLARMNYNRLQPYCYHSHCGHYENNNKKKSSTERVTRHPLDKTEVLGLTPALFKENNADMNYDETMETLTASGYDDYFVDLFKKTVEKKEEEHFSFSDDIDIGQNDNNHNRKKSKRYKSSNYRENSDKLIKSSKKQKMSALSSEQIYVQNLLKMPYANDSVKDLNNFMTFCGSLGSGGFGYCSRVYLNLSHSNLLPLNAASGFYALKAMKPNVKNRSAIAIEVKALMKCQSPFVIGLLTNGYIDAKLFLGFIMELGNPKIKEMREAINENIPAIHAISTQLVSNIADAFIAIGTLGGGILGDAKLRNIVMVDNVFKIIDFGAFTLIGDNIHSFTLKSSPPEYVGLIPSKTTKNYKAHPSFDIWSLGCLVYEFVANQSIITYDKSNHRATNAVRILQAQLNVENIMSAQNAPSHHFSVHIWKMLKAMLKLDPTKRTTALVIVNYISKSIYKTQYMLKPTLSTKSTALKIHFHPSPLNFPKPQKIAQQGGKFIVPYIPDINM